MSTGTLSVQDVITRVQRTFGDESGVQVTQADIIRWINDAQREAVMQNEGLLQKIGYISTVAGQMEYTLPTDLFVIESVYVKDGATTQYMRVQNLPMKEWSEQVDGWDGATTSQYPLIWGQQQDGKILLFPLPQASVANGIKLIYSRYATDVVDTNSLIDLPVYLHTMVVNFCLVQAYEMDEDWESAQQKAQQVQGDLDFNNNKQFWQNRDTYPVISTNYADFE